MAQTFEVAASRLIPAPPRTVWRVLSDYERHHGAILPKPYFVSLVVEKGGKGTGTVLQLTMSFMGQRRVSRLTVTEPETGRVLEERDEESGAVTQFRLEPEDKATKVTIHTTWPRKPGMAGWFEARRTKSVARRVYRKELGQLEEYIRHIS